MRKGKPFFSICVANEVVGRGKKKKARCISFRMGWSTGEKKKRIDDALIQSRNCDGGCSEAIDMRTLMTQEEDMQRQRTHFHLAVLYIILGSMMLLHSVTRV